MRTLNQWKKKKGYKVKDISKMLGISLDYAYKLLKNQRIPSSRLAILISKKTRIPLRKIMAEISAIIKKKSA